MEAWDLPARSQIEREAGDPCLPFFMEQHGPNVSEVRPALFEYLYRITIYKKAIPFFCGCAPEYTLAALSSPLMTLDPCRRVPRQTVLKFAIPRAMEMMDAAPFKGRSRGETS